MNGKNRANGLCALGVEKFRIEFYVVYNNFHSSRHVLHPSKILVQQAFIKDKNKTNYAAMQEENKIK